MSSGITKIALVTGYKKKKFFRFKLKSFHNQKWKNTNMVYSLNKASNWLSKYNCIVSYGDILYEKKAIKNLIKDKNSLSVKPIINAYNIIYENVCPRVPPIIAIPKNIAVTLLVFKLIIQLIF